MQAVISSVIRSVALAPLFFLGANAFAEEGGAGH